MSKPRTQYAEVAGQPKTHVLAVNNKRVVSWNSKMKSGRCCYLLDDGTRCKNPAVGLNTKNGMAFYTVQCKVHASRCEREYLKYKNICKDAITNMANLKKCPVGKNSRKKIQAIQECAALRILWPRRCLYGCLHHPNSNKSKKRLLEMNKRHSHITSLLLKCKEKHMKLPNKGKK